MNVTNNEGVLPAELTQNMKVKKVNRCHLSCMKCFEEYGVYSGRSRYSKKEFGGVLLSNDRKSKLLNIISKDKQLSRE